MSLRGPGPFCLECPSGHPLRSCPALAGTCNGCRKLVLDGEVVMDCRRCNWYLCGFCLPQLQLPLQPPYHPHQGDAQAVRGAPRLVPEDPSPVCVRNTFIDVREKRSESLERFHGERRSQSCPPGNTDSELEEPPSPRWAATPSARGAATPTRAQVLPTGFELPGQLNGAVHFITEEFHDAMNQIREQGVANAVVNNVVAAVEMGAAALPQAVVAPAAPGSIWPQWAPPAPLAPPAPAPPPAGLWGFFNSIDSAIAGTFDKVADDMKDAAQLIREQGMARAMVTAVEQSFKGGDMLVQVGPPVQPPALIPAGEPTALRQMHMEHPQEWMRHEAAGPGAANLPSKGSALHSLQSCKPCAFATQPGASACKNGYDCQFCHLCEPGEKKRRRKTWQKNKREEKEKSVSASSTRVGEKLLPLRTVATAPGQLATMEDQEEEEMSVAEDKASSTESPDVASVVDEEPEVLDWAEASGY